MNASVRTDSMDARADPAVESGFLVNSETMPVYDPATLLSVSWVLIFDRESRHKNLYNANAFTFKSTAAIIIIMKFSSEITIIGGGINGLLTARELVLAGFKVTVLDKSRVGQEASWAGGGILLPLYPWRQAQAITDLVLDSLSRYQPLCLDLHQATGINPEWHDCGLLISKTPDIGLAVAWCQNNHVRYQHPAPDELLSTLQTQPENPLWLPDIAQVRNPRLLKSLKAFLSNAGVRFLENSETTGIEQQRQRVTAVKTARQTIRTDHLIITSGAWTSELMERLFPAMQKSIHITPVRGQMLLFGAKKETLQHMVLDDDQYLIPRRDGKILAGSSVEQAGFVKDTTEQARSRLYQFATALLPALKNYPVIAHWAGLRPGTRDGVPYICRHPGFSNLYINAGHFRNGLTMAPASAALLADLLLDRTPSLDPLPYQVKPAPPQ